MLPPRAERPPAPKRHPWRRYIYRLDPVNPNKRGEAWHRNIAVDEDKKRAPDVTTAVDKALDTDEVLDGAVLPDHDEPSVKPRDSKLQEQRLRDAIEDEFEKDAAYRREASQFEAELIALADGQSGGQQ